MRMDRFYTLTGMVCSLQSCTDVSVYVRPLNLMCEVKGRCSPYVSHQRIEFTPVGRGHAFSDEEAMGPITLIIQNSRFNLQFSLEKKGEGWEMFPTSMFQGLFGSLPWGPGELCGVHPMPHEIYVYTEEIRTRRELAGQEDREEKEKYSAIPDDIFITRQDAVDAGLCEEGIDSFLKETPHLDRGDGVPCLRAGQVKKCMGTKYKDNAAAVLNLILEKCKDEKFISSRKESTK